MYYVLFLQRKGYKESPFCKEAALICIRLQDEVFQCFLLSLL